MPPQLGEARVGPLEGLDDGHAVKDGQTIDAVRVVQRGPIRDVAAAVVTGDPDLSCPSAVMSWTMSLAITRSQ